ncbi:DNA polymerase eta [Orchesella cincta]|uniref:DNA polymerase eta n=1 Tax=Orchesella cincta TaxID=48709 RepID=A0A1D2M406_ORCCI|nr:DNA polymerase eta [Orchesella cincta]
MASSMDFNRGGSTCKVITLIDMDSFECQVWERMFPAEEYWGRPCIVTDQTGRIVSASSEARALGISRSIRLGKAERLARRAGVDLKVFTKPNDREKPDGKTVRYASWELVDALKEYCEMYTFGTIMEYSSCDEFYLDITEEVTLRMALQDGDPVLIESRTFLEGKHEKISGDKLKYRINGLYPLKDDNTDDGLLEEERLVYGGLIMQDINNFLFRKTKFKASVGIGTNKLVAKLACGINKPNGITMFPSCALARLSKEISISSIQGLGGKFGSQLQEIFAIQKMSQLAALTFDDLEAVFDTEKALLAYMKSHGQCDEPVSAKLQNEGVSCGKNFFGQITSDETLKYHLHCLSQEMIERLEEEQSRHRRVTKFIRIQFTYSMKEEGSPSKESSLNGSSNFPNAGNLDATQLCDKALSAMFRDIKCSISSVNITRLCFTAGRFENIR